MSLNIKALAIAGAVVWGGGFLLVGLANLIFASCCDRHDHDYANPFMSRRMADFRFRRCMLYRANDRKRWYERVFFRGMAWLYWGGIRVLGNRSGSTPKDHD